MFRFLTVIVAVALLTAASPVFAETINTQTFDSAAAAAAAGWTSAGTSSMMGYSNTNNTGGQAAGEAGGTMTVTSPVRSYYGDVTNVSIAAGLTKAFEFHGELCITGKGDTSGYETLGVGFFDTSAGTVGTVSYGGAKFANFMGFEVLDSTAGKQRITAVAYDSTGVRKAYSSASIFYIDHNTPYTYDFGWNPSNYTMSLTLNGGTISNVTHPLAWTAAASALVGELDGFGMAQINCYPSRTTASLDAYIDNVSYTAAPEPGTIALLVSGIVGLLAYAWRKRK